MLLGYTYTNTLTDSNGYRDGDSYCYTKRDGYRYGHSCTDTYPWSDTRCADKSCRNCALLQPDWSHVD